MNTISSSMGDLLARLDSAKADFSVQTVPWTTDARWRISDGAISHETGGYFDVVGVGFDDSPGEAVVMLYQPQSAITGLLSTKIGDEFHFLVQARAEPGVFGLAQFGPTVQATPANCLALHGGKSPAHVGSFYAYDPSVALMGDTIQLDLGARYLMKSKRHILASVKPDITLWPNFTWVPENLIRQAVTQSTCLNLDLRSLLAVSSWNPEAGFAAIRPRSSAVCASLLAPVRAQVVGSMMSSLSNLKRHPRFLDIASLPNWELTADGLFEIENRQGFDVQFFQVHLSGREISEWCQPLINSRTPGAAALYCRQTRGVFEVLVGICAEPGLSTGTALLPSFLRYPGQLMAIYSSFGEASPQEVCGKSLVSSNESDEGGRFYRDVSQYELIYLPDDLSEKEASTGQWITVAELKKFLGMSNLCSIQLRGLASMLLGID